MEDSELLFKAINNHKPQEVKELLERGVSPDTCDHWEHPAIIRACEMGNPKIVELLIEAGANTSVVSKESDDYDALTAAIENPKVVEMLLKSGIDVGRKDYLEDAFREGQNKTAKMLLEAGAKVTKEAVIKLIQNHKNKFFDGCFADLDVDKNTIDEFFMTAVGFENMEVIEKMIALGANVDQKDSGGDTPLHRAVIQDNLRLLKMLLEAGADANIKSGFQKVPLSMVRSDSEMYKLLVPVTNPENVHQIKSEKQQSEKDHAETGIAVLIQMYYGDLSRRGGTPPQEPEQSKQPKVDYSQIINFTNQMVEAQDSNDPDKEDHLANALADIFKQKFTNNSQEPQEDDDIARLQKENEEQIHQMENMLPNAIKGVFRGEEDSFVQMLPSVMKSFGNAIAIGAKKTVKNANIDDITLAVLQNNEQELQDLIDQANINIPNPEGMTPLMVACRYAKLTIIEFLLQSGADPNIVGTQYYAGETALTLTIDSEFGDESMIATLVKAGANINHQNSEGDTALILEIRKVYNILDHTKSLAKLLELGADPSLQNNDGETAFSIAEEYHEDIKETGDSYEKVISYEVIGLLKNPDHILRQMAFVEAVQQGNLQKVQEYTGSKKDINCLLSTGSPLLDAAGLGHLEIVRYLISKGANVNISDRSITPLIEAAKGGYPEIVQALLDAGANPHASVFFDRYCITKNALSFAVERANKTDASQYDKVIEILKKAGVKTI